MNLLLTRFSQDVDLSNPNEVRYFLVFETTEGHEVRLPVQKETTEALVKLVYGQKKEAAVEETQEKQELVLDREGFLGEDEEHEEPEDPPDDDGFEDEDLEDLEPGNGILAVSPEVMRRANAAAAQRQSVPASEDEVPSL